MFRSHSPWLIALVLLSCQATDAGAAPGGVFAWYGKTVEEAIAQAKRDDIPYRIVREDDQRFELSRDLVEGRVNWEIEQGVIVHSRTEGRNPQAEGWQDAELRPYVGISEADAEARAAANGVPIRVASRDGEPRALTADYVPERVNVAVRSGIVVHVIGG